MKRLVIALMFMLTACRLYAQNIIPRFDNIGINEGLSQSSVYSIYQDKKGFMWFGTADGLDRYDGENIRVYRIADKKIANSNFIHGNICEDSHGNIWFCNETGIFCYDLLADKLSRRVTYSHYTWTAGIFIDSKNILYIMNPTSGINAYNTSTGDLSLTACRFKKYYSEFNSNELTTNFKNTIWLKEPGNNGLITFNTQTGRITHDKAGFTFHSVYYAKNGELYWLLQGREIIMTDTTMRVKASTICPVTKNRTMTVPSVCGDRYGRVWISTVDNGLICYDRNSRSFTNYLHDNAKQRSLPVDMLSALCIDRSGNLWIGSDGGGVSKLDLKPQKFNLFPLNEGDYPFLKDYFIKCFFEDKAGRIWFGTFNGGLNIYDPATGQTKNYNYHPADLKGLPGPIVSGIFEDKQGLIWIATSMGIAIFNEKAGTFTPVKIVNGPRFNEHNSFVYKFRQLENGEIAAATSWGPLFIKKTAGTYSGVFGKNHTFLTDLVEMSDHTFWVSSPVNGLFHLKRSGDDLIVTDTRFPLIDLRSIHQDEQDPKTLWVCTGIGLIQFNTLTGKQTIFNEKNGMANSYIYGVLEDGGHNFWLSTNAGLCFFNRRNNTFQNYTVKDGLQSNEFNTQAFYKGPSGNLYFGGIRGFNWFNSKVINTSASAKPGVAITSINMDDKPYARSDSSSKARIISLPYDHNNISFRFAALDFTRPAANKVSFILQNWDKKWINSYDKNMRYSNLRPGTYTLRVKAANSDDVWSREETLTIIVNAPFWQTAWFYIGIGAFFLAAIVYVTYVVSRQKIKKRLRQLEKQHAIDAERNRISRDMHDEIGSGLTHIALLSELIQTQQKTGNAATNDLGNISTAARKLVESISEIIWALNPQNDTLENLLAYIREQMQQLFEPFDISLEINFPEEVPNIKLSNEQRRNLYLVTKEALNNVMKHSGASAATLSLGIETKRLSFEINDDGRGMPDKPARSGGNGLRNMRKRIEEIGGTIEWRMQLRGLKVVYAVDLRG